GTADGAAAVHVHADRACGDGPRGGYVRGARGVRGPEEHGVYRGRVGAHDPARAGGGVPARPEPARGRGGRGCGHGSRHRLALSARDAARGHGHRRHLHRHVRPWHPAHEHHGLLPGLLAHALRQRARHRAAGPRPDLGSSAGRARVPPPLPQRAGADVIRPDARQGDGARGGQGALRAARAALPNRRGRRAGGRCRPDQRPPHHPRRRRLARHEQPAPHDGDLRRHSRFLRDSGPLRLLLLRRRLGCGHRPVLHRMLRHRLRRTRHAARQGLRRL
ncbi:MAG: hypothetical protein AVDCRST_MAG12-1774, partial [uncultured Rubrobacteraceae bacterium]